MIRFLDEFKRGANEVLNDELAHEIADDFAAEMRDSWLRQYHHDEFNSTAHPLRFSSVGKPAIKVACELSGVRNQLQELGVYEAFTPDEKLTQIFSYGDYFEALFKTMLRRYGYELLDSQQELTYTAGDVTIKGHPDIIVRDPADGRTYLVEVKTMSGYYYSGFTKRNGDCDERGYRTQLALYHEATGRQHTPVWVCLDKSKGDIAVIFPDQEILDAALERTNLVLPRFGEVEDIASMLKVFRAPPGEVEIYKRKPTGRLRMPTCMKWWPYRHMFYDVVYDKNNYGKDTEYVGTVDGDIEMTDYRTADEAIAIAKTSGMIKDIEEEDDNNDE